MIHVHIIDSRTSCFVYHTYLSKIMYKHGRTRSSLRGFVKYIEERLAENRYKIFVHNFNVHPVRHTPVRNFRYRNTFEIVNLRSIVSANRSRPPPLISRRLALTQ